MRLTKPEAFTHNKSCTYRFNGDLQKLLQPIHIEKTEVVYESRKKKQKKVIIDLGQPSTSVQNQESLEKEYSEQTPFIGEAGDGTPGEDTVQTSKLLHS